MNRAELLQPAMLALILQAFTVSPNSIDSSTPKRLPIEIIRWRKHSNRERCAACAICKCRALGGTMVERGRGFEVSAVWGVLWRLESRLCKRGRENWEVARSSLGRTMVWWLWSVSFSSFAFEFWLFRLHSCLESWVLTFYDFCVLSEFFSFCSASALYIY